MNDTVTLPTPTVTNEQLALVSRTIGVNKKLSSVSYLCRHHGPTEGRIRPGRSVMCLLCNRERHQKQFMNPGAYRQLRLYNKQYRAAHPEYDRAYRKQPKYKDYQIQYGLKNKATMQEKKKQYHARLKQQVIVGYGGRCVCCGEPERDFLTIDHINGGGGNHRKSVGHNFFLWLIKNNFPKEQFQLLCFNCNCAKGFFGLCPHQRRTQGGLHVA